MFMTIIALGIENRGYFSAHVIGDKDLLKVIEKLSSGLNIS